MKVIKLTPASTDLNIVDCRLLTKEEAANLPDHLRRYDNLYWLMNKGDGDRSVAVVINGVVDEFGYMSGYSHIAIRPCLILEGARKDNFVAGNRFVFNGSVFEIVNDKMAFCVKDIGVGAFSHNTNSYSKSWIKAHITDWFWNGYEKS